ncbi:MAG: RNA-binding S4 domain-containing protein [Bacteroidetes bacterium]|nr:RNA-binding S4 domain-containing protein [Bacteroidota bacterium]HET6244898.1 RNA-binding S4 domain-containing protein [Bacteroidia bacterium]
MIKFKITTEYIELIGLLKATGIALSGAEAKAMVEDGLVRVNGELENRKRAKLRPGAKVETQGQIILVE